MTKFVIAILVLVLAYFAFHTRTEPPKEVQVEEISEIETEEHAVVQTQETATIPVSSVTTSAETPVSAAAVVVAEADVEAEESIVEKDEPRENVDQTVIANEKKLAEVKSAEEAFELLRKLRLRIKKLSEISVPAKASDYVKFWGSYEGPIMNNRNELIYNFNLTLEEELDDTAPRMKGSYNLKAPDKPSKGYTFSGREFGARLVGRDSLVITSRNEDRYFQLYKLDNGHLAGNYYEKKTRSYRVYRFILKKK